MTKGNEAFSRVIIDAQLKDQGWNIGKEPFIEWLPDRPKALLSAPAQGFKPRFLF